MRITLRQLAIFEAAARHGSLAKAADEIGLTASAASMSLKELEAHLGVELFARQGKRLLLSDRGRQVREMVKSILVQVSDVEALSTPDQVQGRLRVGASSSVGNYVLPELCAAFMKRHSGVRIELSVMPSSDVMDRLQKMSLDVGFVGAPVNSSYLQAQPWLRDPLVICCAPDSPLARSERVLLSELSGMRWALEKTDSSERIAFTAETLKYVSSIHLAFETDSVEIVKRLVRSSDIIACLSRAVVVDEISRGEIVGLKAPELDFMRIYSIVTRRGIYRSWAHEKFFNFSVEYGAKFSSS